MNENKLFAFSSLSKKRIHYKEATYKKEDSINRLLKKNNTEIHIFRYPTLYKLYNKLYLLTFQKPLAILNYYIEDDGSLFAEIKDSHKKYLKERVLMHVSLLRRVKNNDLTLEYVDKMKAKTQTGQLSLFQ